MWVGSVSASEIRTRSRWKVELYCEEIATSSSTAFDLVALRHIVDERKESLDPQVYPDHLFNYLGLEHIRSITGDLIDFAPRKGKEIRSRSKIFRRGDVLYGRLRPYLNKVYIADGRAYNGICSGEFHVLVPRKDRVLPIFLRAVLASHYVQQYVSGLQTGSALPRLHLEDLLKLEIPLPPLATQQIYEAFLRKQDARRRQLMAELALLPNATVDAIVDALQSGREPRVPVVPLTETNPEDINQLPNEEPLVVAHMLPWMDD